MALTGCLPVGRSLPRCPAPDSPDLRRGEQRDEASASVTGCPAAAVEPQANSIYGCYSRAMEKPALYRTGNVLLVAPSVWHQCLKGCNPAVRYDVESGQIPPQPFL